jgi:hypothetical protein
MKSLLLLSLLSLPAFAEPAYRCELSGEKLWAPEQFKNLLLDQGRAREIAFVISEPTKDGSGVLNTYAHLDISLRQNDVRLGARTPDGQAKKIEISRVSPLTATISFPSRAPQGDLSVNIRCEDFSASYLFLPFTAANHDPYSGSQSIPTTAANLLENEKNFSAASAPSKAEYIAGSFCVAGDLKTALSEIGSTPALWRKDLQSGASLAPVGLELRGASIVWQQRRQSLECTRSHQERIVDSDTGEEITVTVCDETHLLELSPVTVSVGECAAN